jgi:pimeloyl-ACP methyl ester carboxylesterase
VERRDHDVTLGGMHFRYRSWGRLSEPLLVFLHGVLLFGVSYELLLQPLAAHRHVLALDQRGHGETDHAGDYSWPRWVEDLDAFCGALDLESFDLVGHSLGANNAARFAGAHPSRVRHLVLLDGGIGPTNSPEEPEFWRKAAELSPPDGFASAEAFVDLASSLFPRADPALIMPWTPWLDRDDDGRWRWRITADLAAFTDDAPAPQDESALRGAVRCPVLVVKGQFSELFVGDTYKEVAGEYEHGTAEVLPDAGHMIMWENTGTCAALTEAFLKL